VPHDCFEVVNEPNLQLWPQPRMAERVAEMITTVDAIARRHDEPVICLAPSLSDAESDKAHLITEQRPFIARCSRRSTGAASRRRALGVVVPQLQRRRARR
jgi:hypothetical protein